MAQLKSMKFWLLTLTVTWIAMVSMLIMDGH